MVTKIILTLVIGYLLGSVNSAIIVSKFFGIDIRATGSKNAGLTNVLRSVGKNAALLTLVGDILKGVVACLIGGYIFGVSDAVIGQDGLLTQSFANGELLGGFAAVIGHNWPIYFKFHGGKGVLSTCVVVLMIDWKVGLSLLALFIIIVALTRMVSLGSLVAAFLLPIVSLLPWYGENDWFYYLIICMMSFLIIIRHAKNIVRIIYGRESRLGEKNKSKTPVKNGGAV